MKYQANLLLLAAISLGLSGCSNHHSHSNDTQARTGPVAEQKIDQLLRQLTLEEKVSLVHASGKFTVNPIERLGIPEMWLSDGPHGVRHQIERDSWDSAGWDNDHATYLPNLTAVAASWDLDMATLHGDILGSEARHRNKDFILGPGVNLARLPLYGRNFEYMGEDPILAAKLVVPAVKAIQHHDVAATVKHYALNTQELNRFGVNAKPDERTLREVYLPAFEAAVKEGDVLSIMGAYNQYYGTNANQSKHLIIDILKGEWGFNGVLLTDWNVDINTYDAAMNGLDLEMGTDVPSYDDYFLAKPLLKQIQSGKIPTSVLDDKVRRILRLQQRIGMNDHNRKPGARNTPAHQAGAREIAANGVVLLKNQPQQGKTVLPLNPQKLKNILVMGPNANKKHGQGGGSSEVKSLYEITPLAGLKQQLGNEVNIKVLRAKSQTLSPIASDYVASRHWTGTPSWNISFYQDSARTQLTSESWIADSQYQASQYPDNQQQFVTMKAQIKPVKTGNHQLKVKAQGQFKLKIDGKLVLDHLGQSNRVVTQSITLNQAQSYAFEIHYDGQQAFTLGWDAPGNLLVDENTYLAAAKQADAVIYFGGLSHADDRESIDRLDMKLPGNQDETIGKLLQANPNTVVFMIAGSAVEMPWAEQANAILWGWYSGMESGNAFSDILLGKINPAGKMPITLPQRLEDTAPIALDDYNAVESSYKEGVFIGYRWFEQQQIQPLFPFGHGLSYTSFDYSEIELSTNQLTSGQSLTVKAKITNTGQVAGAEVVQLYLHDQQASVSRPFKELKGFDKVWLKPGQSQQISITIDQRDLSFWDINSNDWLAESGAFTLMLGASSEDIKLQAEFNYKD